MATDLHTWILGLYNVIGSGLAGPSGGLIGSMTGGLVTALVPRASDLFGTVFNRSIPNTPDNTARALLKRFDPVEKRRINHDLQTALRDALREAIYDLGGERCFPQVWSERPRQVDANLLSLASPTGDKPWQNQDPLAEQICQFFKEILNAIAEQRLLPLAPPHERSDLKSSPFSQGAESPLALTNVFFNQAIWPFLRRLNTPISDLPVFEKSLRRDLIDRMLIHLGKMLKAHSPAWSAYNRLVLEGLRNQIRRIDPTQVELIAFLDGLLAPPTVRRMEADQPTGSRTALTLWISLLADLISAAGRFEKQAGDSFDTVLTHLGGQQDEALLRFKLVLAASGSDEIVGTPTATTNEPPVPGKPPYKGLQPFSVDDADLFFGREKVIARLVDRLVPVSSRQKKPKTCVNFLAVIGVSGCGKTSLVKAGMIPALQHGQPPTEGGLPPTNSEPWLVHLITPTAHPLHALAESLTSKDSSDHILQSTDDPAVLIEAMLTDIGSLNRYLRKLLAGGVEEKGEERSQEPRKHFLLIVDQFEELFTLCAEETERKAFLANLLVVADNSNYKEDEDRLNNQPPTFVVMILLRADYYAYCADYEDLRQAIVSNQEYIGPLSSVDLRCAIEKPAYLNGWEFESGLVSVILHDLGADEWPVSDSRSEYAHSIDPDLQGDSQRRYPPQAGVLPVVSHTLLETWKHRRGRVMTLESYAETSGVRGSITKTAETAFHQLDADQQAIARNVFMRLTILLKPTTRGEEARDICCRTSLDELSTSPENAEATQKVLQSLSEAGLIILDAGSAEITHEVLMDEWPALRKWLDKRRQGFYLHRQINSDSREWRQYNDDPERVYHGIQLAQALEWAEANVDQLSSLELDFLEFSSFVAERKAATKAARSKAQRQSESESSRILAEAAKTRRKAEATHSQLADQTARRQMIRNIIKNFMIALVVMAAIMTLILAWTYRQQKVNADLRAEMAFKNQLTAQAASTQAFGMQITAQAESHTHATAESDALSQMQAAEDACIEAQRQSRIALVRELSASSTRFTSQNVDLALLLAVEAVDIASTEHFTGAENMTPAGEAQTALFHALQVANFSSVLRGHTDRVLSAAYSNDGKYILTTSQDGTARLWDLTKESSIVLRKYTSGITSAVFSPDGAHVLTTGSDQGQDGVAELWKLDGTQTAACTGHTGVVTEGGFSPDGALIVTTGQDKTARLWKEDCTPVVSLTGHTNAVTTAIYSPDRTRLLTLSTGATAWLWMPDGSSVATLTGHTQPILDASFNPDGSRIITASADGTARIWLADGTPVITLEGHTGDVFSAIFSPSGQMVLTSSADGTARLWRADGSPVMILTATTLSNGPGSKPMAIYSPDGTQILTAGGSTAAQLWNTDGTLITTLTGHTATISAARFNAEGSQIVTTSADHTARIWDLNRLYAPALGDNTLAVTWAGFSPDGIHILTAGQDGIARFYLPNGVPGTTFIGHSDGLTNASFSPDGQLIATASRDGTARIWRPDGTFMVELRGHTKPVRSVNFSPDSKLVVTASEDGTARLFRVSGSFVLALEGHTSEVWSAFFSPDGNRIITASLDGTARVWNVEGQLLSTIYNNDVPVSMATFNLDGQVVITAGQDGIARLWLTDGTPLVSLAGHPSAINWAAFSPDGKLIATASNDGTVHLWTMDGQFLACVEGDIQRATSVEFSSDGRNFITASWDGMVQVWSSYESLEAMQSEALHRVGRWLTQAECQLYLHQDTCPENP